MTDSGLRSRRRGRKGRVSPCLIRGLGSAPARSFARRSSGSMPTMILTWIIHEDAPEEGKRLEPQRL